MLTRKIGLCLLLLLVVSSVAMAQPKGIPVDIPGTDTHFFLYRYEGDNPPYQKVEQIWERLSNVFLAWVEAGQDPAKLGAKNVTIKETDLGLPGLFIGDTLIVEVDEYHARINHATPRQLAEKWAENLETGVEAFVRNNLPKR